MNPILLAVGISLVISFLLRRRILSLTKQAESERETIRRQEELIAELKGSLANVNSLKGILPICASCKRIRDDNGDWTRLEMFIRQHSDADFSHGLCPECVKNIYSTDLV